jgi:hypothetical protein
MAPPISIKLRCNSWKQLAALYKRDLARSAVFLKSSAPPPLETPVRIHLTLPNRELVILDGVVSQHIPPGGLNGRGPGVDIKLPEIPAPAMAKIQAALENPDEGAAGGRAGTASETAGGDDDSGGSEGSEQPGQPEPPGQSESIGLAGDDAPPVRPAERVEPAPAEVRPTRPTPPPPTAPVSFFDDDLLGDLGQPAAQPAPPAAAAEEQAVPSLDAIALVARLEQERESLRKLNAFQILGVGYETTDEAVHEAFASLSQRYHPERFAGDENEVAREIATEIFALIRAAHRLLESSTARERLRKELNRSSRGEDGASGSAPATREKVAAPASPQEEIPTKPVLVAEDGTRVGGDVAGVPAAPQEEIPTKPAVVSSDGASEQAARPPAPPPTPKTRPPAPPPIPGRGAAPPPVPKTRPPAPPPIPGNKRAAEAVDEDIIPVDDVIPLDDDVAIELGDDAPAAAPVSAPIVTETSAPTPLVSLADDAASEPDEAPSPPVEETPAASELGTAFDAVTAPPVAEPPLRPSAFLDETDFSDAGGDAPAAAVPAEEPPPPVHAQEEPPPPVHAQEEPHSAVEITIEPAAPAEAPPDYSDLGLAAAPRFAEAAALLVAGRFNEAATAYRMIRRRDPDDTGARVGAELCEGLKALANRDKLEAAQRFEVVLELDPENRRAATELAEMKRQAELQRKANLSRLREQQD